MPLAIPSDRRIPDYSRFWDWFFHHSALFGVTLGGSIIPFIIFILNTVSPGIGQPSTGASFHFVQAAILAGALGGFWWWISHVRSAKMSLSKRPILLFGRLWIALWVCWCLLYLVLGVKAIALSRTKADHALGTLMATHLIEPFSSRSWHSSLLQAINNSTARPDTLIASIAADGDSVSRPFIEKLMLAFELMNRRTPELVNILQLLSNLLNNIQSVLMLWCFLVFRRTERKDMGLFLIVSTLAVLLLFTIEGLGRFEWANKDVGFAADIVSGVAGGVTMGMLVSRMANRLIHPPASVIALLYLYVSIQGLWPLFDSRPDVAQACTLIALGLKMFWFIFVLWLLDSGALAFYFWGLKRLDRLEDSRTKYVLRCTRLK